MDTDTKLGKHLLWKAQCPRGRAWRVQLSEVQLLPSDTNLVPNANILSFTEISVSRFVPGFCSAGFWGREV